MGVFDKIIEEYREALKGNLVGPFVFFGPETTDWAVEVCRTADRFRIPSVFMVSEEHVAVRASGLDDRCVSDETPDHWKYRLRVAG